MSDTLKKFSRDESATRLDQKIEEFSREILNGGRLGQDGQASLEKLIDRRRSMLVHSDSELLEHRQLHSLVRRNSLGKIIKG